MLKIIPSFNKRRVQLRVTILAAVFACMLFIIPRGFAGLQQPQSKSAVFEPTPLPYKKIALVIGNSNYESNGMSFARDVATAISNDGADMQATLSRLGFEVTLQRNLTRSGMIDSVKEFVKQASGIRGVALFYYSGHGVEYEGNNYILPIDTHLSSKDDIPTQTINVNNLVSNLKKASGAENRIHIFLLDACRDMPAEARSKGIGSLGPSAVDAPNGSAIGFATAPGKRTSEMKVNQRNSTYTAALLKYLPSTNLRIEDLFVAVRKDVLKNTDNAQEPWSNMSGTPYVFNPVWKIEGTWKSEKTGSIFKLRRQGSSLKVLIGVPSASVTPSAKENDLVFDGTILDDNIVGLEYFTWTATAVAKCPNLTGTWHHQRTGKISDNGNTITWSKYNVGYDQNCKAVNLDLDSFVWRRWQ